MAASSSNLTEAEQAFLAYDWANSEKWQSYLMNLYPVPPQNKILKWKIKFFKAQENADLNPESPAFAAALAEKEPYASWHARPEAAAQPSHSSTFAWSQPRNTWSQDARSRAAYSTPVSTALRKVLPSLCVLGLLVGLLVSFTGAAGDKAAPGVFTYSSTGALLLFFSFLAHLYLVLGKPPFRLADLTGSMSNAFASYLQQAIVEDSTHAMLYLIFTSTMPRSLPAFFSPTISAVLIISSLVAAGDGIPAFICTMPLLRRTALKIQTERIDRVTETALWVHGKATLTRVLSGPAQRILQIPKPRRRYRLLQHRADIEVFFGIFFIASRVLTLNFSLTGSIVPAFLYIHLLKIRYSTCGFTHTTFQRINGSLRRLVYSPACPRIVATFYEKVQAAAASFAGFASHRG